MDIKDLIKLLGGLGLFLYGMFLMGTGLKSVAGGKLQMILERLSSTPLKGLLLGTVVTAVIQSSSATPVMVVGFVNSGIMKLSQAIGVVMGANIGTTATGWILSMAGIQGETVKPTDLAPIIVLVTAVIIMFAKDVKKKQIASICLGFSILMWGMSFMSQAADPLTEMPEFTSILTLFSNPFFGILAGAVITAIIQSSSATVGILQALSVTGTLSYSACIPIIIGMDIGACVPVLISGIGANKNGKRTALIYLLFNLIGSIVFMACLYSVNAFVDFAFMDASATASGIAVVNTVFKVFAAAVLLPLTHRLEALVKWIVKDESGGKSSKQQGDIAEILDERFVTNPGYAVQQCKIVVDRMAELARENIAAAIQQLYRYDPQAGQELIEKEELTDEYEDKLGTYLVKLSSQTLTDQVSRDVSKLLHSIGDFERLSDHALNIYKAAEEIHSKKLNFSEEADQELIAINKAVKEILDITVQAFQEDSLELAARVEPLEQVIDIICGGLKSRHIERLRKGVCTIETGFVFNDLINDYERISDHCSNIAVCLIRLKDKDYNTHEYLNRIKNHGNEDFDRMFDEYKEKYLTR
jgi:phosphate:Na+ symporter